LAILTALGARLDQGEEIRKAGKEASEVMDEESLLSSSWAIHQAA